MAPFILGNHELKGGVVTATYIDKEGEPTEKSEKAKIFDNRKDAEIFAIGCDVEANVIIVKGGNKMSICNIQFNRTLQYEEVIEKLRAGCNVYLCGTVGTAKSTMAMELRYDLGMKYVYISIPSRVECHTLHKICETILLELNIEVKKECLGGASPEDTLSAIKLFNERVLFVFDDVEHYANSHPDFSDEFQEWLHDLCMIASCQVVCVGQDKLNKGLPSFFKNKCWRNIFDIIEIRKDIDMEVENVDIKLAMQQWMERELSKDKYNESFLKLISMGINGELELLDAIRAASTVEYYNINVG